MRLQLVFTQCLPIGHCGPTMNGKCIVTTMEMQKFRIHIITIAAPKSVLGKLNTLFLSLWEMLKIVIYVTVVRIQNVSRLISVMLG